MNWNKYDGKKCKVKWFDDQSWTHGKLSVERHGDQYTELFICHNNIARDGARAVYRHGYKYSWSISDKLRLINYKADPETEIINFKLLNKITYDL